MTNAEVNDESQKFEEEISISTSDLRPFRPSFRNPTGGSFVIVIISMYQHILIALGEHVR